MNEQTAAQQEAIKARGNVLVVAGAGAGKTRTLVERCLAWLMEAPQQNSLDQILMVTFTEAAGAEMRNRLRERLEKLASTSPIWSEQLALLETANIGTLHSFCYRLVRRHFYELGLDPHLLVLAEDQTAALSRKTLDSVLETQCQGDTDSAQAVQNLLLDHGRGWDQPVRDLILRLHHYSQTLANPDAWYQEQLDRLHQSAPDLWIRWLMSALQDWQNLWLPTLNNLAPANVKADECAKILTALGSSPSREQYASALKLILDSDNNYPNKQKTRLRAPLENLFEEAAFLHSVCAVNEKDPLVEDWNWIQPQTIALLEVARRFGVEFAAEKKKEGGLDFHDLEQFALQLLWNRVDKQPTPLARQWQKQLRLIFVDEYQDINAAQDAIIRALGGDGKDANRFLVGDIKQSIYRFRLANPRIFLDYQNHWQSGDDGKVISLSDNFRSHESILTLVNSIFSVLMKRDLGGIEYDQKAHLHFGNRSGRISLTTVPNTPSPVELRVLLKNEEGKDANSENPLNETEKEARWIAHRLIELKTSSLIIQGCTPPRPIEWKDMVILLRSPHQKVESYVKEFTHLGVPLTATRGGFFESLEIRDLVSLLQVLDNPLQDYPLLGVLRSPIGGFSGDDLALIRAAYRRGRFWTALATWHEKTKEATSTEDKILNERVKRFWNRFHEWRRLTRDLPLSRVLERIFNETHYVEWLQAQDRGDLRRANAERLLQLTRQFDVFQREGLFRFLTFVQGQQDIDTEPAAPPVTDAVRLMSIHQSKGLEFPVVVLADLGKKFNLGDTNQKVILDEEYGLCSQVKPPESRQFYPSLPFWLAQRRQKRETLGEELRLLYVALTRASERLILVGSLRGTNALERWQENASRGCGVTELLSSSNTLEWVGMWLALVNHCGPISSKGANSLLNWQIGNISNSDIPDLQPPVPVEMPEPSAPISAPPVVNETEVENLEKRIQWRYPFEIATQAPAKKSVSTLRHEIADEEASPLFDFPKRATTLHRATSGKLSAAERGTAHHAFLEYASFDHLGDETALESEAKRLVAEHRLSKEQASCLDFKALLSFWQSPIGRLFLAHKDAIHRELAFTARFSSKDASGLSAPGFPVENEYVVVQGVIDLCAILTEEIWLLDFKTDQVAGAEQIREKTRSYEPQLELYARAISRIHRKPVTKSWLHFLAAGESVEYQIGSLGKI